MAETLSRKEYLSKKQELKKVQEIPYKTRMERRHGVSTTVVQTLTPKQKFSVSMDNTSIDLFGEEEHETLVRDTSVDRSVRVPIFLLVMFILFVTGVFFYFSSQKILNEPLPEEGDLHKGSMFVEEVTLPSE